ncbi:hypothetical protein E3T55_03860 [Cryobacterium frigoriphilum]|uniref:Uncharacterized protein n=1 Tax=Cryobacterium frigoriphilum TaxID=1259150 RepID=A0A4R9A998_9MICO|nr:hypothetical protein [Cryobacterium frigoriphilum]TFD54560.1 hypothetical protein E3T55_03860 [Cryobacterium frigoriphilum]
MDTLPAHLHDTYIARYAPGLAAKYRRNHFILAGAMIAVLLAGLVFTILGEVGTGIYVTIGVMMVAFPSLLLISGRELETRWSSDDRLAIAIGEAGVVLPCLGLIGWSELTSIVVYDNSLAYRKRSLGATTTKMMGLDMPMYVDFHVADSEALLVREANPGASNPRGLRRVADRNLKFTGFKGVQGEGMLDPTFQSAVRVLVAEAESRGIPVEIRVPANVDTYRR